MPKHVSFRREALDPLMAGLNKAANAVGGTMGPSGLNVYFSDPTSPEITNDGVTVAGRINLADPQEDAGAYIVRNVTGQQNDDVGDGTTTVAVLLQSIVQECLLRPENMSEVKRSLKKAGEGVIAKIVKSSKSIKDVSQVALVSAEDPSIANLITEITAKLGKEAVVNVEESRSFTTDYEIVDGYEAQVGFMSPHFINEKRSATAVYEDIPVVCCEKKITGIGDIAKIFEMFKEKGITRCVLVVDDIDDSMLGIFVNSKIQGTFQSIVIRATGWLNQDIAGVTGATAISDSTGVSFHKFEEKHLGHAKKVVSGANQTLFIGSGKEAKAYAKMLDIQAENDPNRYTSQRVSDRAAKIRGGIALLRIAAPTDQERKYLVRKAEDAVKAVKAALAEGVVEGGGMCLWRIAQEMKPKTIGEEILKKSLTAPLRKIIENAGLDYAEIVTNMPKGQGYNAKDHAYQDLLASGIVDPAKVERCAVQNSVSAASQFITTFTLITDAKEDQ